MLDLLQSNRGSHLLDGPDLLWIGFNSSAGDQEAEELARRYPEDAFLGVELQAGGAETVESLGEMFEQGSAVSGLNHEIVCRRINSSRRDPERPLFRDSAGGMILSMFVGEINENECDGRR